MSALWRFGVTLAVVLCLSVSPTSCSAVKWRKPGMSVTIKCKCGEVQILKVQKGLHKNESFYSRTLNQKTFLYPQRSEDNGPFPNVQILLKNLTHEDTGVYWCMCTTYSSDTGITHTDGVGSVLLVVAAGADWSTDSSHSCDEAEADQSLVLISVVITSAVLLVIFSALLLLAIRKVRVSHGQKPRVIRHSDVYEDMRGSRRR